MKKTILFTWSFILVCTLTVQAQSIVSYDYGAGLAFPMNQTSEFDFDEDGNADIKINPQNGKLGIKPIFFEGCILAYPGHDPAIDGIRIKVLEEGEPVELPGANSSLYYEEDHDLPLYGGGGNTYTEWDDNEANYVGLLSFNLFSTGWMKIRVDVEAEVLYILSYGYNTVPNGVITVGETQDSPVGIPDITINELNVFPNPVSNILNVELELTKASSVDFILKTMNGQQIRFEQRALNAGKFTESINVADLANGMYQLVVQSGDEFITKAVTVGR